MKLSKLSLACLTTTLLCTACGGGGDGVTMPNSGAPVLPDMLRQALQASPAARQAAAAEPSLATVTADQVMDWAEAHLAERFPGHANTVRSNGFVYRYYPATGNFIAVSDDGNVGALLPAVSQQVLALGTLSGLGCTVNPALSCLALTPVIEGMSGEWPVKNHVLRTDAQWAQAWAEHRITQSPEPQRPVIDFSRNMLLGIAQGWQGACDNFGIKRVIEQKDALRVEYTDLPPPPNMACPAVVLPKISFVQLARSDKPVVFVQVSG